MEEIPLEHGDAAVDGAPCLLPATLDHLCDCGRATRHALPLRERAPGTPPALRARRCP